MPQADPAASKAEQKASSQRREASVEKSDATTDEETCTKVGSPLNLYRCSSVFNLTDTKINSLSVPHIHINKSLPSVWIYNNINGNEN